MQFSVIGVYEEDEILIDSAIQLKVFQFLNNTFLLNNTIYKEVRTIDGLVCLLN